MMHVNQKTPRWADVLARRKEAFNAAYLNAEQKESPYGRFQALIKMQRQLLNDQADAYADAAGRVIARRSLRVGALVPAALAAVKVGMWIYGGAGGWFADVPVIIHAGMAMVFGLQTALATWAASQIVVAATAAAVQQSPALVQTARFYRKIEKKLRSVEKIAAPEIEANWGETLSIKPSMEKYQKHIFAQAAQTRHEQERLYQGIEHPLELPQKPLHLQRPRKGGR